MKPTREEVREAWHAMDRAEKAYVVARAKFVRLRDLRYPRVELTPDEMAAIEAALCKPEI